ETFMAAGLPCGPIQNAEEVAHCPHIAKRDLLIEVPDPIVGKLKMVGSPIKMEDHEPVYGPLPNLGADTENILKDLGYSDARIKELRDSKTI
nr:CoA transferase [Synergistaceae bacterium]